MLQAFQPKNTSVKLSLSRPLRSRKLAKIKGTLGTRHYRIRRMRKIRSVKRKKRPNALSRL